MMVQIWTLVCTSLDTVLLYLWSHICKDVGLDVNASSVHCDAVSVTYWW